MRLLLFTGKGGVGKTTVAAATALAAADRGARTLVMSTDPAHSLADAFGVRLGGTVAPVVPGLWGQQLDSQSRLEDSWGEVRHYLASVLRWAGIEAIEAEELTVVPGVDELFALSDLKHHVDSGAYDVVVVDCAPTAETLRLLSLPEILSWAMGRLFPISRQVSKLVAPMIGRVSNLPVPEDDVFGALRRFYDRLDGVREVLADTEVTSVRLVVNPERMVIAEARRTYTYLSLFGYPVDAVVANRLLPDSITDPWFRAWKEAHAGYLSSIEEAFAPVPVLRAHLAAEELVGVERLRGFATHLYGERDPTAHLHRGTPLQVERAEGGWRLTIELPFAEREDVSLSRKGDELFVRVGAHRRAILLPDSLRRRQVCDAVVRNGRLDVLFQANGAP